MLTAMLDGKHAGRRRGLAIREGAVRQARLEANLSLAKVAADKVSRTAIHLIETGRTRPSLETLELIARQTGKSIDYFLAEDPRDSSVYDDPIGNLRRLTLIRDFPNVIALGSTLLQQQSDPTNVTLVHFYIGQAYCRLVRPREALEHLPSARAVFEQQRDEWMAVDALDWESSALGLLEDPRAISLAHQALERCRQLDPKPVQTEVRILGHIAAMYVASHTWTQAIRYFEYAVEAAGGLKDILQLAKMHHGLGTAYQRLQQPIRARQHFDKAAALYSIESDLTDAYVLENDLGDLLLHQGQLDAAEQHLRKALQGSIQLQIDRRGRGYILTNLGEVSLRRGQLSEAARILFEALEVGHEVGERVVLANAHLLLGQVETQQGNSEAANEHFELAIHTLEDVLMPERLRECHMRYAESLYARGDTDMAAMQWKAAAEIATVGAIWSREGVVPSSEPAVDEVGAGPAA